MMFSNKKGWFQNRKLVERRTITAEGENNKLFNRLVFCQFAK